MKISKLLMAGLLVTVVTGCRQEQAKTIAPKKKQFKTVSFGQYPQKKKIKWYVLDHKGQNTLLLSENCIDSRVWDQTHQKKTWDLSDVRHWLNHDFVNQAFTSKQKKAIKVTSLKNKDDLNYGTPAGKKTKDRVFLLSGSEAKKYLAGQSIRKTKPKRYASDQGCYTNEDGNCAWWLRSPGMNKKSPAYIASNGDVGNRAHQADEDIIGIRPAMWVKTDRLKK